MSDAGKKAGEEFKAANQGLFNRLAQISDNMLANSDADRDPEEADRSRGEVHRLIREDQRLNYSMPQPPTYLGLVDFPRALPAASITLTHTTSVLTPVKVDNLTL